MKNIKVTIILLLFVNILHGQKENYIWYFGDHAGIDFNTGVPAVLSNGMINTDEGCASICNKNGSLLFYTDGLSVWDFNHNLMSPVTLAGGYTSTQSALIVPFPNSDSLFYIFTVQDYFSTTRNFSYSVIDMSLDNGYGDVSIVNTFVTSPVTEKLTAVKHFNNNDVWVMVHEDSTNNFLAYLVTSTGFASSPVISSIGPIISGYGIIGYMKFSPDGTKIALAFKGNNYIDLFDFNSTSGIVTNEKQLMLPTATSGYGIEFSTSSTYLYCTASNPGKIYQWDISSNSASIINSTRQIIGTSSSSSGFGSLQLAPNGKIYAAEWMEMRLGVINNPELSGSQTNYQDSAIYLGGKICHGGLPNYIQSSFLSSGFELNELKLDVTVFPNPTNSKILVLFQNQNLKNIKLILLNTSQQTLFSIGEMNYEKNYLKLIDLTQYPKGVYILKIIADNKLKTMKIVKQ